MRGVVHFRVIVFCEGLMVKWSESKKGVHYEKSKKGVHYGGNCKTSFGSRVERVERVDFDFGVSQMVRSAA